MTVVSGTVRDEVLRLEQIPPLSVTANVLIRVAADPDVDARQLAGILEKDAALTARIIGLANSAFFGQSRPVLSMDDAIIRVLGLDMVRSLALSMALAGSFDISRCPAYDLRHYWLVSLGTAALSRDLAIAVGDSAVVNPDAAYLCGLLHSLGELALLHLRPDLMCEIVHAGLDDPDQDVVALERARLGVNRWQTGEWLAFRWHLPDQVQHSMGFFATGSSDGVHQTLVQIVASARTRVLACLTDTFSVGEPLDAVDEVFERIAERFQGRMDELRALASSMV